MDHNTAIKNFIEFNNKNPYLIEPEVRYHAIKEKILEMIFDLIGGGLIEGEFNDDDTEFTLVA